jgi:hypothetical protein
MDENKIIILKSPGVQGVTVGGVWWGVSLGRRGEATLLLAAQLREGGSNKERGVRRE